VLFAQENTCNLSHTRPPAYSAPKSFKHQWGGGDWGGGEGRGEGGGRRDTSGNYNARPKYLRLYGTDGKLGKRYSGRLGKRSSGRDRDRNRDRDRDRDKDRLSISSYYASASAYTTHDGHGLALTGCMRPTSVPSTGHTQENMFLQENTF
jgi:hypothetical protein